jgi:hypothetical protein
MRKATTVCYAASVHSFSLSSRPLCSRFCRSMSPQRLTCSASKTKRFVWLATSRSTKCRASSFSILTRVVRDCARVCAALQVTFCVKGYYVEGSTNSTYAQVGDQNVPVVGFGTRGQITAVECVSMAGEVLPTQLIFAGACVRALRRRRLGLLVTL